mmetsp:Transcript_78167/g.126761  ORF Transcript_78167/g.126761 Transcript_78167/m.126761 type:complete len:195 (+) Transcript_78167:263-847(+)
MRSHTYVMCAAMVLATLSGAGAASAKDKTLQTSVPAGNVAAATTTKSAVGDSSKRAHLSAPVKRAHALMAKQSALAMASLQKKDGVAPSELHATLSQSTISKRFSSVRSKQLAKVRLGEKALIGTYPSPSAKNIHDSMEYLPFMLPPIGLALLGGVTFGVLTIRKWQKIPSMPTQGRLDIKDVQASARQMQSKV